MEAKFLKAAFGPGDFPPPLNPEVVFVGRSNVGKSTLINTLLNNRKLAKTSSTPGKTRSINFYQVGTILFVDLPGYGYAKASKELRASWERLILSYFQNRRNISLAVVLLDVRRGSDEATVSLIRLLEGLDITYCFVLTKADKVPKSEGLLRLREIEVKFQPKPYSPLLFSAKMGLGKTELWNVIVDATNRLKQRIEES
ncbi:MAG: ribosome biogenesis GTP-binding protein YihA/YsxC [Desulfatiglandales bacterium]